MNARRQKPSRAIHGLLIMLVCAGLPTAATAQDAPPGVLYAVRGGTIAITGYVPGSYFPHLVIPPTIEGKPVTTIDSMAFQTCDTLFGLTLPATISHIGSIAFNTCENLGAVYFQGNAPTYDVFHALWGDLYPFDYWRLTVFYVPGHSGFGTSWALCPVAPWKARLSIGEQVEGEPVAVDILWGAAETVVLEACTNLADPAWIPVCTNTLTGDGATIGDLECTNHLGRFYRIVPAP